MVDLRVLMVAGGESAGLARHVRVLADHLARRGVSVSVAAERPGSLGLEGTGARLITLPGSGGALGRAVAARAIRRETRTHDLVHAFDVGPAAVAAAGTSSLTPLIITWHGGLPRPGKRVGDALERFVARRATTLLCASQDQADRARAHGADATLLPPSAPTLGRVARSRASVRAEIAPGAGVPGVAGDDERPIVLCVGRLVPAKGQHVLVEAAAQMVDRHVAPLVLVAGEGPRHAALERLVANTGAPVRLLGHRPDVADLLQAADVVVVPSLVDGCPLVVAEALRAGAPIVASDVGGIGDTADGGALLVTPGDPDGLARAIAQVLDDPRTAGRLRTRGADAAERLPTDDGVASQVLSTYHRAMLEGAS